LGFCATAARKAANSSDFRFFVDGIAFVIGKGFPEGKPPMDMQTGEEVPPKSTDLDGWRQAIATDRLKVFRLEALAAAFQDLGDRDHQVQHALTKHLSDSILHLLRKHVGMNKPNQGEDIIFRVHGVIFAALLLPSSPDGKALRLAFGPRVLFRLKDAIAAEERERRVPDESDTAKKEITSEQDGEVKEGNVEIDASAESPDFEKDQEAELEYDCATGQPTRPDPSLLDGVRELDEYLNVEGILDCVTDSRKRLAFNLYMNDVPFKTKKTKVQSIAQALKISEKTARAWVEEVRVLLSEHEGVKHLKKSRVGARS
jgi:hypothetical protein